MLSADECAHENKTLLLVEDDAVTALSQRLNLERGGYKVIVSATGEEAIDRVRNDPSIALVLMDIDLGEGIDGTETAGLILREKNLPVVFLSGHAEKEVVEKVRDVTRYGYVLKGSGRFVLLEAVQMALELFFAHEQRNRLLEQNRLLLREVHHRVKNNMSTVRGLLSLQASATSSPEVKAALQEAINRVGVMTAAYESLSAGEDYTEIPLAPLLRNIISSLSGSDILPGGAIIRHCIEPITLPTNTAVHVGIIINELISNCRKHAFPDGGHGTIRVSVHRLDSDAFEVSVADNGVGMPRGSERLRAAGTGLEIVRNLARQYDGTLHIDSDGGARITVRMNIS